MNNKHDASPEEMKSINKLRLSLVDHMETFGIASGLAFCLTILTAAKNAKRMFNSDGDTTNG